MCIDELEKEKKLLEDLLQSDSHKQYVADLDEQVKSADNDIFASVPQTDGEMREREQKMGFRNFAEMQKQWFTDRLDAVKEIIAEHKLKQATQTPDEH